MNKFLLLVFFACTLISHAQRESAIWYFGENAGLDFSTGIPRALVDGTLVSNEGSASISNAAGELLFYTNGTTVWNRTHEVMQNGQGLLGDVSSTQSAIIVPLPESQNLFYVFTVGNENAPDGINYSIVDMEMGGGFGAVVQKNVGLNAPTTEKLTAVSHGNGKDVWILFHESNNDVFVAYLLTETGLAPNPTVSAEALDLSSLPADPTRNNAIGYYKASPDGTQLAICHRGYGVELLLFDTATGEVNFPITLTTEKDVYGVEFSPSGEVLYVSIEAGKILQYDLTATNIAATETVIEGTQFDTGALQLGLDGKIYVANYKRPHLSVINNPDIVGLGCNFQYGTIDLGGRISNLGLPNFVQSFFVSYVEAENFCLGDTTSFTVGFSQPIENIVWDFGEGTVVSGEEDVNFEYALPGEYQVAVYFTVDGEPRTEFKFVTINPTPIAHEPPPIFICSANESFNYNLKELDELVLQNQNPSIYEVAYFRNEVSAMENLSPLSNSFVSDEQEVTLYARVNIINSSDCYDIAPVNILVKDIPEIPIEKSYVFCPNSGGISLDGGDYSGYRWTDPSGETISTRRDVNLTVPGFYTLTVLFEEEDFYCEATERFEVRSSGSIEDFTYEIKDFGTTSEIVVNAVGEVGYRFSLDNGPYQESPIFNAVSPGKHKIIVTDDNGCNALEKEVIILGYQKFFTPNADGNNESWQVLAAGFFPGSKVQIFNRYGRFIAEFTGTSLGWDGTSQGSPLPSGNYWFKFILPNEKPKTGFFILKR